MKSFAFVAVSLALYSLPALAQASVDELVGFGSSATGGGDAEATTVTTCEDLASAVDVDEPAVVLIDGLLSGCSRIDVKSDKTILGAGTGR
jgi:pectate lyase